MKFSLLTPTQEVNFTNMSFEPKRVEQSKLWKLETKNMYLHYDKDYGCPILNAIEQGRAYFQANPKEQYTILQTLLETGKLRYIEFHHDDMIEEDIDYLNNVLHQHYQEPVAEKKQLILDMLQEMVVEVGLKFRHAQVVFREDNQYTDIHVYPNLCMLPIREKEETNEIIFRLYEIMLEALQGEKPTWTPVTIPTKTEHPHPLQKSFIFVEALLKESGEKVRNDLGLEKEEYEALQNRLLKALEPYQTKTIFK